MRLPVALLTVLLVLLGVGAVVAGGRDDSPGLQLLGVLLVVAAFTLRRRRRAR